MSKTTAKKTTTKKTSSTKPASKTAAKQPASKKTTSKKPATKRPARAKAAKPGPTPKDAPATPQPPGTPATGPIVRMTCLDAAHAVLVRLNKPMRVRDLMEQMIDRELWTSPAGLTPESTLAAAIGRDIAKRGADSRFQRVDRGFFAAREWEG